MDVISDFERAKKEDVIAPSPMEQVPCFVDECES